jgi:CotH kinase protein
MRNFTTLFLIVFLTIHHLAAQMPAQKTGDLFDMTYVHDVRLAFNAVNWASQLDSLHINGSEEMLIGKVTIDGTTYDKVGIAYAKSPTYMTAGKRNPWSIKLNYIDKKQSHNGYKAFSISQALRDPSMVREVLGYEMAHKYVAAPRANYTNLSINNENRGVHVSIEAMNEDFLQKNFGYTEGSFFRCVPDTRSEMKGDCERSFGALKHQKEPRCMILNYDKLSKEGWDDLIELTRVLNDDPQNIGKILDIDRTLWFLAFNNVVANLNGYNGQYSGNYYLYRDRNGLFNFIPTEMNLIFGSMKATGAGSDLDFAGMVSLDPLLHSQDANKPLISQLLKNQDFKRIYFAHIRQILGDWFENGLYQRRAEELQRLMILHYEQDKTPPYPMADFKRSLTETVGNVTKIPGVVELMTQRTRFLRKHSDILTLPPIVSEVMLSNRKKYSKETVSEFRVKAKVDKFPRRVRLYYRACSSTESFTELAMLDDGKNHDAEAGDKIFGAVINPQGKFDCIEYYILAENAGATSFYPANYMTERGKATLAELNK